MSKGSDKTKQLANKIYSDTKEQIHISVQRYINQILSK